MIKCDLLFLLVALGLQNIQTKAQPTHWLSTGIGGGGALFSPSISPHDGDELFVACDMTNLFHSENAGRSWEVIHFEQIRALPDTRVHFTIKPNVLYALHYDFKADFKIPVTSRDGGVTWSRLVDDPTEGEAYYLFADPHSDHRLIVSNYDQIFLSLDGGRSFQAVYQNPDNEGAYIAGVFWDGQDIYLAVAQGILLSTDGGLNFVLQRYDGISDGEGIVSFSGARRGNQLKFYAITLSLQDIYPTVTGAEHWGFQSCYTLNYDSDKRWVPSNNGLKDEDHPFYMQASPGNPDIAYLAGGNSDTFYPIVYKTENGGSTWQEIFRTVNNQNIATGWSGYRGDTDWWYGEYALGLAVSPTNPDIAVFTDLGYVHMTTNGGASWEQRYVEESGQNPADQPTPVGRSYQSIGLENTSCWWLTWIDQDHLFASFTDVTGIRSKDGGMSWSRDYFNLDYNSVYQVVQHPDNRLLYAAVSTVHDIYQSTYLQEEDFAGGEGGVMFSSDGGRNWDILHLFGHPVIWLALDPSDPNVLYASVVSRNEGDIYRTSNLSAGANAVWKRLASPPRTEGHPFNIHMLRDGTLVTTYSGRRDPMGTFTGSSGVFISTDQGASWLDRSDPGMYYWTKDLIIDANDENQDTWYVSVFSGWGDAPNGLGGLYKTEDRGQNWIRISDLDRVESCSISPNDPEVMYVTTEADGLWYTDQLISGSPDFQLVETYPFQHPVRVFFDPYDEGKVWVTSFGNGIRVGVDQRVSTKSSHVDLSLDPRISTYPNPVSDQLHIEFTLDRSGDTEVLIINYLGQVVGQIRPRKYVPRGKHELTYDLGVQDPGIYHVKVLSAHSEHIATLFLVK